jgi:hypothetical protein
MCKRAVNLSILLVIALFCFLNVSIANARLDDRPRLDVTGYVTPLGIERGSHGELTVMVSAGEGIEAMDVTVTPSISPSNGCTISPSCQRWFGIYPYSSKTFYFTIFVLKNASFGPRTVDTSVDYNGYERYNSSNSIGFLVERGRGSLSITSTPSGAEVYVFGPRGKFSCRAYNGTTPQLLLVEEGSYAIKLTKSGYADVTKTVYVSAEETTYVPALLFPLWLPILGIIALAIVVVIFVARRKKQIKSAVTKTAIIPIEKKEIEKENMYTCIGAILGAGVGFGIGLLLASYVLEPIKEASDGISFLLGIAFLLGISFLTLGLSAIAGAVTKEWTVALLMFLISVFCLGIAVGGDVEWETPLFLAMPFAALGAFIGRAIGKEEDEKAKEEKKKVKEEQILVPISKSITIERAVYDPCKRDFIERPLPRMKEWINRYDPGAYWFALSVQNNTDRTIEEWSVELETSSALKIKESEIEGMEIEIPHEAHLNSFRISVPKEYGIVIPKGGAQRVYFKLRADKPKTTYEISGVFKSAIGEVPIRPKEFKYLCDAGVSPEAVKAELKKVFSEKDAARLALSFKTVQEIDRMCNQDAKTEDYQDGLSTLKNYTEGFSAIFTRHVEDFSRFMKEEQLDYLDDAYKEKVRRFCTNLIDVWISEFLKG